jgi:rhodanese-related sulfurtransferase
MKRHITLLAFAGLAVSMFLSGVSVALAADTPLPANRYNLPRNYHSEISAAEAYLKAIADKRGWGHERRHEHEGNNRRHPVIIDVRSIPEYVAGHPEHAYNIPYPFIYQECAQRQPDGACINGGARIPQDDTVFVDAVMVAVPDKDTPIYTLCRTGHRSVLAANLLTAAGYTHVRNIWQGFVGQTKVDYFGNAPLDLNHDGQITDADKDGWRYYQGLPYETKLRPRLLYQPYIYYYYQ